MADVILHLSDGHTHLEIVSSPPWASLPARGEEVVFELADEQLRVPVEDVEYVFPGRPVILCRMTRSEAQQHIAWLRKLGFEDAPFPRLVDVGDRPIPNSYSQRPR